MQNVRNTPKPRWRKNGVVALTLLVLVVSSFGLWISQNYLWRLPSSTRTSGQTALILDPLALNYPDQGFVVNLTSALTHLGYAVNYLGPSSAGIDTFRRLPSLGYDLIVIRAHSASQQAIITAEPYSRTLYKTDQASGGVVGAVVNGGPSYFAVTASFVRNSMAGRFQGSSILVMGCSTVQGQHVLADAFLDKGAQSFVGWDNSVTIIHTDRSTVSLVSSLSPGGTLSSAVSSTSQPDPVYGARLRYLDWNMLVQTRANSIVNGAVLWLALASMVVLGPLVIFVAPRFISALGNPLKRFGKNDKRRSDQQDQGK